MQELLFPQSWGTSPSQDMDVFTNLEAPQIFVEVLCQHDQSLTSFPAPLPSPENGGGADNSKPLMVALPLW